MWSMIPILAMLLAQGQSNPPPKWCFERDQDAPLCEASEDACKALLDINREIARSSCKPVEQPPPQPGTSSPPLNQRHDQTRKHQNR